MGTETVRRIQEIRKSQKPGILFLMETKNSDETVREKLESLNYENMTLVSPHSPGGGGLALLWDAELEVDIIKVSQNFFVTSIKYQKDVFHIVFLYGEPDQSKRRLFWQDLTEMNKDRDHPWLITGDFNEIVSEEEKEGGPRRTEGSYFPLRSFIAECDLYDVKHSGNCLSWRGRRNKLLIQCRLDRSLANGLWFEKFPQTRCKYLRLEASDHRPLITHLAPPRKGKKRLFRYDRSWRTDDEAKEVIKLAWREQRNRSVVGKIANCKENLLEWNKKKHVNYNKLINLKKEALDKAMSNPQVDEELVHRIKEDLERAYRSEEEFWRQRSRQLWLALGDRNSAYFHASTKGRRAINNISVIENEEGKEVFNEEGIVKVITAYFQDLFGTENRDPTLIVAKAITPLVTGPMNDHLVSIPDAKEIKQAFLSIHADKAPGPDGFSASFFHTNWAVVQTEVVSEIQGFFRDGILPQRINETHIRLIPKIKNPKSVKDYRPLALCNVYYKAFSKILTRRLKKLLNELISENQSAFVPDRAITDNVLITHEMMHFLKASKATKHSTMAVKTDMSKAYDRLEWNFIQAVLKRFGFHGKFVGWVMQCISTVSFSVLINGEAQGEIIPHRGIRQGDPLSPFLFILCSEVLSGLCLRSQRNGELNGIQVAKRGVRINHILFADDTMFFTKTDERSCGYLKRILEEYEIASGQTINKAKSAITFSGKTTHETRAMVKLCLGIEKEGGNGKYLGMPELFGRRKKDLFTSIVDRIKQKAASWTTRRLSGAGKLTLLKAVLAAIPNFSMASFKLPLSLCKRIQSALTRFWWDANPETKGVCWIAWKQLVKSKKAGGLGFRDVEDFNDALLAKVSWRIHSKPNCLLAKLLKSKYCKKEDFMTVKATSNMSHGWRGILIGRDLLARHMGFVIGNGSTAKVWDDPWVSLSRREILYGPATEETKDWTVSKLFKDGTNQWDKEKLNHLFPDRADEIQRLQPSREGAADKMIWLKDEFGIYTAKSGYYNASGNSETEDQIGAHSPSFDWMREVWKRRASPKLQIFLWKMVKGALATRANLAQRKITPDDSCIRCGGKETTEHLLYQCQYAQTVWREAPFEKDIDLTSGGAIGEFVRRNREAKSLPPTGVQGETLFAWICWQLWSSRNKLTFEGRHTGERDVVSKATAEAREWTRAQEVTKRDNNPTTTKKKRQTTNSKQQRVKDITECWTDASWMEMTHTAGLGWIIKAGDTEDTRKEMMRKEKVTSPLMAETLACREALIRLRATQRSKVRIYSDSLNLIRALTEQVFHKELYGLLMDINKIAEDFESIEFSFVPREDNREADYAAKSALNCLYDNMTVRLW